MVDDADGDPSAIISRIQILLFDIKMKPDDDDFSLSRVTLLPHNCTPKHSDDDEDKDDDEEETEDEIILFTLMIPQRQEKPWPST